MRKLKIRSQSQFPNGNRLLVMSPAFGTKYLISPYLNDVYGASQAQQQCASFLFLFIYAIARFVTGLLDSIIKPMWCFRLVIAISIPAYIICGYLSNGKHINETSMWGFVAAQCVVGTGLGASKVLFFLILIHVFGQRNFLLAVNATLTSFSLAGFIGPLFGWWGLSGHGKLGKDRNYGSDLSNSVAVYNYICSGACLLAMLFSFFIRPVDFRKYGLALTDEEEERARIHRLGTFSSVGNSSTNSTTKTGQNERYSNSIVNGSNANAIPEWQRLLADSDDDGYSENLSTDIEKVGALPFDL